MAWASKVPVNKNLPHFLLFSSASSFPRLLSQMAKSSVPRKAWQGMEKTIKIPFFARCQKKKKMNKTKSSFVLNTELLTNIWPHTLAVASKALVVSRVYRIDIVGESCRSLCPAQVFTQGRSSKQVCLLLKCLFLWTKRQDIDNNK